VNIVDSGVVAHVYDLNIKTIAELIVLDVQILCDGHSVVAYVSVARY
jgi:hypothetical protein